MDKQIHYLLVGLPFSGKTTLAKALEKRLGYSRLSIDDVKFELGFEEVSDDDISDENWDIIFEELDRRITKTLLDGKTLVNEYAWLTKEWRDRARSIAEDLGIETKLIYLDVPENTVRERREKNRKIHERFDVPDDVFEESLRLFERPSKSETALLYKDSEDIDTWITIHFAD